MPIRKKGDVEIQASANGTKVKQTGYTFYSYDKNAAALYFQFRGQDGQPTDLGKATIHLVMILNDDGGEKFIPGDDEIEVISAIRGTAKYVLPEMLLSYSGKVTGYVYMDFDDGSQTDDGQFTFRIKHSMITHVLPKAGDKYVQDFEDVKERVEQAGDSATKDIEKAKDSAESQIGDYVGEVESAKDSTIEDIDKALPEVVESAKQDISSSASDVQSKADQAKKDMQDNVYQVESDYQTWKEQQEAKQDKFENATDKKVSNIAERVGEAENKVSDLESNLDVAQKNYFSIRDWQKRPDSTLTNVPIMKIQVEKNQKYTLSSNVKPRTDGAANIFLTHGDRKLISSSIDGVYPDQPKTVTTKDDGVIIVGIRNIDITEPNLWIMLNKGEYAVKWTPNTNDIVTVKQYKKLEQAVINLGGSI